MFLNGSGRKWRTQTLLRLPLINHTNPCCLGKAEPHGGMSLECAFGVYSQRLVTFSFTHPHSLLESWNRLHSSADSPGRLPKAALLIWKPSVFFSAEPSLQVICLQGLWVCWSVVRHLLKPLAGYSESLGDQTYHNMPTRPRIYTLSWAGCSIIMQPYPCKTQPQGGKNLLQRKHPDV